MWFNKILKNEKQFSITLNVIYLTFMSLWIKHFHLCCKFYLFDTWVTLMMGNKLSFQNVLKLNTCDKINQNECYHILTKTENVWKSNNTFSKFSN